MKPVKGGNLIRPLAASDESAIDALLQSRGDLNLVAVSWTSKSIVKELETSQSLGLFSTQLDSLILYKEMTSVLEILFIFSRKGVRGAANRVLRSAIDAHSHVENIWLEVHENNDPAIRFYERQGFEAVSVRRGYYSDGKSAINYNLTLKREL